MRFFIHLLRLAIFSFLVSITLFGTWVVAALILPETVHGISLTAWHLVDAAAESAYYNLGIYVGDEPILLSDPSSNLVGVVPNSPTLDGNQPQATATATSESTKPSQLCEISSDWIPYTVKINDSINSLAAMGGVSESLLLEGNCLSSSGITSGQKLYLPFIEAPSSVTPISSGTETQTPSFTQTATSSSTWTPSPSTTTQKTATPTPKTIIPTATNIPPSKTSQPTRTSKPKPSKTPTSTALPTFTSIPAHTNTPDLTPSTTSSPQPSITNTPIRTATPTSSGPQPTATVDLSGCIFNTQSSIEQQVLDLLNQERANVGQPPLIMQSQLRKSAREHSADMACNDFVSHTGSNGTQSYDRITSYGYYPSWWGENIYMGYQTTPEEVVNWWMNSEPHRKNILHSVFVHIGIGHVAHGNTIAYTLNFGRP